MATLNARRLQTTGVRDFEILITIPNGNAFTDTIALRPPRKLSFSKRDIVKETDRLIHLRDGRVIRKINTGLGVAFEEVNLEKL